MDSAWWEQPPDTTQLNFESDGKEYSAGVFRGATCLAAYGARIRFVATTPGRNAREIETITTLKF
jgi:hypothetical protein